jgi:hypothetical protein
MTKFAVETADIPTTQESSHVKITNDNAHHFLWYQGIVHFEFIPQGQTVNQAYYMEILKSLHEVVCRRRPEFWPSDRILHHDSAPSHRALFVKRFLAQKLFIVIEHPPSSPDLALNDFCLFLKIKSALKGRKFQDIEHIPPPPKKKGDSGTESYSMIEVPKMFPTLAVSLG